MPDPLLPESRNDEPPSRFRTLIELSSAIAAHPNLSEVLPNLRRLLSNLLALDGVVLVRLDRDGKTARLLAFDQIPTVPQVEIGAQFQLAGSAVDRALNRMEPVFIADLHAAMLSIPQLAPQAEIARRRCAYVFPIATPRARLGALVFASAQNAAFSAEDVELMASASSQAAVALDREVAAGEAERYRIQLEEERDRLGLLLDINNQIIAKTDPQELFRSASATIRKYFRNDCAGFWLRDGESRQFECTVLDFPARKSRNDQNPPFQLATSDLDRMSDRLPRILDEEAIASLSGTASQALKYESIRSLITTPLVATQGVVGVMMLGSRCPSRFRQPDSNLLLQVGNQIALALDSAIAYGRLDASKKRLQQEKLYLESEIRSERAFEDIVGESPALRKVLDQVSIVAPTRSTVLLHGETGTGKELIARAIHQSSPRLERTFVKLNCAAIPAALVESELFGHEKGAFTGAIAQKRGRFEVADRGTLFLDEVGDISLELQPKLLRAIQEQEFERVGSNRTLRVDVRLVAATPRHDSRKTLSRRSLLSPQRLSYRDSAPARAPRRYSPARPLLRRPPRARNAEEHSPHSP